MTDEFEAQYGANLYEWDFYYGNGETDGGRSSSHGSQVALAVETTNPALERIDLQISSNSERGVSLGAMDSALDKLIEFDDAGWRIGAYNMSWGRNIHPYTSLRPEIADLAARGIYGIAAAGNGGSHSGFELPTYPGLDGNVIAVGSHDGAGNPSDFSQNHPSTIHVLADGENFPVPGAVGSSFSAPQVAATVGTAQAYAEMVLDRRLSFEEVIDVLQLGGAGPRSSADPADGATTYFLHTHQGSVDYLFSRYIDPEFSAYEYLASYADLRAAFGPDMTAARTHLLTAGVWEGREVVFDGLEYIASHADLIAVFGADREAGATHYIGSGTAEGRQTTFDGDAYLSANADLQAVFGSDGSAAARHYIEHGFAEGRATGGGGATPIAPPQTPLQTPPQKPPPPGAPVSEGTADLPSSTATTGYVGVGQGVAGYICLDDRDWFEITLTAGRTVVIEARGSASGGGTLFDPELYLRGAAGDYVTGDLNGGAGRDAYLVFTPSGDGTYYLEVDGYSGHTGSYTLSIGSAGAAVALAGPEDPASAWAEAAAGVKDDGLGF